MGENGGKYPIINGGLFSSMKKNDLMEDAPEPEETKGIVNKIKKYKETKENPCPL